jgi:hypothetical protein
MSSDGTGVAGDAVTTAASANGAGRADAGAAGGVHADQAELTDPWFAPGPKAEVATDAAGGDTGEARAHDSQSADAHAARQAEWFLRTGRAGLLPDSMTVAWDDDAAGQPANHDVRPGAAGAPPWAGDTAAPVASAPPPWETGPWPGPGGFAAAAGAGDVLAGEGGGRYPAGGVLSSTGQGRWPARTVVTAGLIPLVVPGLVLGVLSLRQPAGPALRRASWLAICASVAWALIIILIVAGTSSSSGGTCAGYPAAVRHAYQKVMADLSDHAPAPAEAADLGAAADRANASAAAAGQFPVRTALFAMASDMAEARADIVAQHPVPATLRQHLVQDGAAPTGSCAS